MVTEPTDIDGGVFDMVLTDVSDLVGFGLIHKLGLQIILSFL